MTIVEFIEARLETQRAEAQYVLNLLTGNTPPLMLGSLRASILDTCRWTLAQVEAQREVVKMHTGNHGCGDWPTGCPTVRRLAAVHSNHSDYQVWLRR